MTRERVSITSPVGRTTFIEMTLSRIVPYLIDSVPLRAQSECQTRTHRTHRTTHRHDTTHDRCAPGTGRGVAADGGIAAGVDHEHEALVLEPLGQGRLADAGLHRHHEVLAVQLK